MDPIQKYTDLTYGFLILVGVLLLNLIPEIGFFTGLAVGIFIGYIVHVGSEMVEFSQMEEQTEQAAEHAEKASETAESVQETIEKVEDTTEQVAEAVRNGN